MTQEEKPLWKSVDEVLEKSKGFENIWLVRSYKAFNNGSGEFCYETPSGKEYRGHIVCSFSDWKAEIEWNDAVLVYNGLARYKKTIEKARTFGYMLPNFPPHKTLA